MVDMVDFDAVYAKLNNDQVDEAFDMLPDRILLYQVYILTYILFSLKNHLGRHLVIYPLK